MGKTTLDEIDEILLTTSMSPEERVSAIRYFVNSSNIPLGERDDVVVSRIEELRSDGFGFVENATPFSDAYGSIEMLKKHYKGRVKVY